VAFSLSRPGWEVAVRETCTRRSLRPPFDQGLGPSGDAEGTQRCQLGRAGRPAHELALAERAHQQDAEAEFVGQRQDGPLDLPVRRKVTADASSAGNQIAAVQMG
jgi:hypothetical protein